MTFEQWWARLTPPEHRMVPRSYALFIWNAGRNELMKDLADTNRLNPTEREDKFKDGRQLNFFE